ncbi:dolichol-p-mannose mannosyltransferase, partial [Obelidium mucronatum]
MNQVLLTATATRGLVLAVALIVRTSGFVAYDSSSELIGLGPLFPGLVSWDAVYFAGVAQDGGYVFEQSHAFFPGLPLISRGIASLLASSNPSLIVAIGLCVSNIAFIAAAAVLYRLSVVVLKDHNLARASAILFCFSPSAAFMSSMYTESLFAMLSFSGMLFHSSNRNWLASVTWMLAGVVRSNAIVFIGFFLYQYLKSISVCKKLNLMLLMQTIVQSSIVLSGFAFFQYYGYTSYCHDVSNLRPWCRRSLPLLYSFVQKEYWNVGFLQYWTPSQIPNFLLAAPMVITSFAAIRSYFYNNVRRFLTLGLVEDKKVAKQSSTGFYSLNTLPHIFLCLFLTLYCLFCMHVQVITRFFTSMPVVYWYLAHCILLGRQSLRNYSVGRVILGWFVGYGAVGVVLFSLFYPPA